MGDWCEDQEYQLCLVSFRRVVSDTVICVQGGRPPGSFIHTEPVLAKGPWTSASLIYAVRYCLSCKGWQHHGVIAKRQLWCCRKCHETTVYYG